MRGGAACARLAAAATHVPTLATGTSAHLAPEALSRGHLSRPGDVYSFGIFMAEMWTRVRPFAGGGVLRSEGKEFIAPSLPPSKPPHLPRP